jgi:type I restriction enzyme S subunit
MIKELTMEKKGLPVGWEMKTLGEVCEINPKKSEINNLPANHLVSFLPMKDLGIAQNQIKPITIKQLSEVKGSYTYFKNNDVLLAKVTPCFENGKLGIAKNLKNEIGFGSSEYIVFRPKNETLSEYLFYILSSSKFRKRGKELMYGAVGLKRLSKDYVKNFIALFPPIEKQKQIVATLDKAFAAIDTAKANAEQNLQNAKELFESYLQNVFENKGDDWEEKTIGDIGKPSMCKRILKQQTTTDGDIPFYKIGTFGKVPNAYISKELYEEYKSKYSFPKKGDILISASGTIGRRVIYDGEPAFFQDSNIVWIDNDEKQVLNEYLFSFYGFCDWNPSKGATISRLYNANLKRIKITFPKSLEEQKIVIQKIEVLSNKTRKLEAIYTQKIADLDEMKKSVLQKAFSGQLNTIN